MNTFTYGMMRYLGSITQCNAMNKQGPVIIIEDDKDDQMVFSMIIRELGYKHSLLFFEDGEAALAYLKQKSVYPFLIFSDIHLPKINGYELKEQIQSIQSLRRKYIPYLFLSSGTYDQEVVEDYRTSIQGFFLKPPAYCQLKHLVQLIFEYWLNCYSSDDLVPIVNDQLNAPEYLN